MTKYLYSGQYMLRRIGRRSPNSWNQIHSLMPAPDGVLVGDKQQRPGWTLASWRKAAGLLPTALERGQEQRQKIADEILVVIEEELVAEEKVMAKEITATYRSRRKK